MDNFISNLSEDELAAFESEMLSDDSIEFFSSVKPAPKTIVSDVGIPKSHAIVSDAEKAEIMRAKKAQTLKQLRARVKEIKKQYVLSGRTLELSTYVTNEDKKNIISILTESFYIEANAAKEKLTKEITKELWRFVPMTIRALYKTKKEAFAEHAGFDYETTPYYGRFKLTIKPDVPSIFEGRELDIIKQKSNRRIFTFDKLVEKYYYSTEKRLKAEIALATKLKRAKTVLDLLDLGLRYYEAYMKQIENKQEE